MAVKKSDLYSSLWEAANKLRGWMDATSYKDYVLVILFVKYVTDKAKWQTDFLIEVPEWGSFDDMIKAKWQANIGERLNMIVAKLAEKNELSGVITTNFDDETKLWKWKEMVDRLTDLITVFQNKNLDFSKNRAEWDDILWDVYEYFMKKFATEAGKSKGQFYTPAEVSRIMAKIIWVSGAKSADQTVYDMTCWSGSLLLKAGNETDINLTLYWQEKDPDVAVLARMNMILHGKPTAEIATWNTLSSPEFKNDDGSIQTFDYCVANPPFSDKDWMIGLNPYEDKYHRFDYWIPPEKNWDYAFLSHMIKSLKQTGKWAIILPHGVLFRWDAEWNIRKEIIKHWYIKWIIGLPANLFYWTGIPACIIMLDKEWAANRKWIFMIEASKWFIKDGNKNRLREQDIHKIVTTFLRQDELPKYSRFVTNEEIEKNEYNLNIPRYIDTQEEEDIQDIKAHLEWWIPNEDIKKFDEYRVEFMSLKNCLFEPINSDYSKCKIDEDEIQETILNNHEFKDYSDRAWLLMQNRANENIEAMRSISSKTRAKEFIADISEKLLQAYKPDPLIQSYDVYQHLMDYRDETMQDDVYIIIENGWKAETRRIIEVTKKGKEKDKWWTCDLLPKELVANEYFKSECDELERSRELLEDATAKKEEMQEEYWESWQALDWITSQASAKSALKAHKWNPTFEEDNKIIEQYLAVLENESKAKKEIKDLEKDLDDKLLRKYPQLTENEVKDLVVNKKRLAHIDADIEMEQDRVSQVLTQWIKTLIERYWKTLWEIKKDVDEYENKVNEHLKKMWFSL